MSSFNAAEPALLFDRISEKVTPWPGGEESAALWREQAMDERNGSFRFEGMMITGWCEPLGG